MKGKYTLMWNMQIENKNTNRFHRMRIKHVLDKNYLNNPSAKEIAEFTSAFKKGNSCITNGSYFAFAFKFDLDGNWYLLNKRIL